MTRFLETVGDEKNLHPAATNVFFNQFSRNITFTSLVLFAFFVFLLLFLLVCLVFFEIKDICSDKDIKIYA